MRGGLIRYLFRLDAKTGRERWSRVIGTSRSIWPRISSRGAHRVVMSVYNGINDSLVDHLTRSYVGPLSPDGARYSLWLRDRLARSDIAQRLAGGIGSLPDVAEALPQWARPLERLQRPVTLEQTTWYVIRHLEWLLDPSKTPKAADWTITTEGELKGKTALGIYDVDKDTWKHCFGFDKRPEKFESKEGSKVTNAVLKRVKK